MNSQSAAQIDKHLSHKQTYKTDSSTKLNINEAAIEKMWLKRGGKAKIMLIEISESMTTKVSWRNLLIHWRNRRRWPISEAIPSQTLSTVHKALKDFFNQDKIQKEFISQSICILISLFVDYCWVKEFNKRKREN